MACKLTILIIFINYNVASKTSMGGVLLNRYNNVTIDGLVLQNSFTENHNVENQKYSFGALSIVSADNTIIKK